uniref:Uncharacterized protein n=1 Tax=Arundo donax TaxID=35708 RepID=A0A0A9DWQ8_ARUDO
MDVVLGGLHRLGTLPLARLLPAVLDRAVAPGLFRLGFHGALLLPLASLRLAPLGIRILLLPGLAGRLLAFAFGRRGRLPLLGIGVPHSRGRVGHRRSLPRAVELAVARRERRRRQAEEAAGAGKTLPVEAGQPRRALRELRVAAELLQAVPAVATNRRAVQHRYATKRAEVEPRRRAQQAGNVIAAGPALHRDHKEVQQSTSAPSKECPFLVVY